MVIWMSETGEPDKCKTVNITTEYLLVDTQKRHRTRKFGEGIFYSL